MSDSQDREAGLPSAAVRPPLARDPWAWLTALSVLPLVLLTRGTPRGEAVAEDFDFLRRAVLEGGGSWFDGGGSLAFWRPVSHQLYYRLFGELILEHPARVAALHVVMLAAAALLLYRVFRRAWPGPTAMAAASFPLMAESTRTLVCWPSHFVDLGAFLFLAVALHEAAHRRAWSAVPAMFAALLCKELAIVGVVLLPFVPGVFADDRARRLRWLATCGAVAIAWAAAYLVVRRAAGLELPHALERDPGVLATPLLAKLAWALGNSLRATFSLARAADLGATLWAMLAAAAATVLVFARSAAARERLAAARGWVAWGGAWCLLSWAALSTIFPFWAPNRGQLGSVGFGAGAVAIASAAHPAAPAALVAARLGMLALAPRTPSRITPEPEDRGAFMDYPRLSRLQQLMAASRRALRERHPVLPHGALVGWHDLPLSAEYAFGGPLAVQAWYRDSSLGWTTLDAFAADPTLPVAAFLSYQPAHDPQVVVIEPEAEHWKITGVEDVVQGRWAEALDALDRADAVQRDRRAAVFLGDVAGRRALALASLGRWEDADREARLALAAAAEDVGARFVLAAVHMKRREDEAAEAQLDTLLAMSPRHEAALALREALVTRAAAAPR